MKTGKSYLRKTIPMSTYTLSNFRNLPVSGEEELKALEFGHNDVLSEVDDSRVRRTNLEKALSLARSERYKTALVVGAGDRLYRTDAAVIGLDEDFAYTSLGFKIPIRCILSVDFYS